MTKLEEIEIKQQELAVLIAEYKEPKFWLPQNGKIGWYVDFNGSIFDSTGHTDEEIVYNNTYETEELATKARDTHLAENRLKQEIFKLNGNNHGKFTISRENWFLYMYEGALEVTYFEVTKYYPHWMYMTSSESAESLKASHSDDLLLVLGQ